MARLVSWAVAGAFCISCALAASAASVAELRAAIDGVYTLEEWHSEGQVLRPPQVDGRFVLMNGTVTTVLLNDSQESNRTSNAQFGKYVLDETNFSYGYDIRSSFTQTPSTITVSRIPSIAGMRRFAVSVEGNTVHFKSGQQEFVFTPEGLRYSENGKLLRVWRRAKAN
jgi:hypothetical protein